MLLIVAAFTAQAAPDLRFDVVTLCCNCTNSGQMLCEGHFAHLNFPTTNGHYLAMGDDGHRADLATNGNALAIYYNNFNADYTTNLPALTEAAAIESNSENLFTNTGPRPNWIVLNEISSGTWPASQSYRTWVCDVAHALHVTYGYNVITYAPFAAPGNNNSDWQTLAADSYIGIENYLSGEEILANNFSTNWCQSQYQASITAYNARGVATAKLILGEHFSNNTSGSGFGRSGVSSNDWDHAIITRDQALLNIGYPGFIGYSWGGDTLNVSSNEMVHFEDTYATNPLPTLSPITAPGIALQPQGAILPPGSTAAFVVFKTGTAPTSYQWRFKGANISGATASSLMLTNVGPLNGGNYSVQLSNAAGILVSSNALLTVKVPDPLVYEPFADASASGGTTYTPGANVTGQTNAQHSTWYVAGTTNTGPQPVISSGSLSLAGLALSSGNSITYGNTTPAGPAARINVGTTYASGTLYYSCLLRISNLASLPTTGVTLAGFNNSTGSQTGQPGVYGARLYVRLSGSGYNLGLNKADGVAGNIVWDTTVHSTSETLFLVASYTINTATTTDDSSALWINPDPATFGVANVPTATLTAAAGTDISASQIASFLLRDALSTQPVVIMDELRIGASWASVTPPGAPSSPLLTASHAGGKIVLSWPTNSLGFTLETVANMPSSNLWTAVTTPVVIVGNQYVVTNNTTAATAYFRLRWP